MLCHVYARATRSVSIPAPVYCKFPERRARSLKNLLSDFGPFTDADIVCSRAKNHFDPNGNIDLSDTSTQASGSGGDPGLDAYRQAYRPPHGNQKAAMYFSVSKSFSSSVTATKTSGVPSSEISVARSSPDLPAFNFFNVIPRHQITEVMTL